MLSTGESDIWVGGEWEIVTALQEAAAEQSERSDDRNGRLNWNIGLGGAYHLLGDYPRGIAHLQHGLDNGDRGPVVLHEMRARPLLARLHVSMNGLDAAAKEVDRCHQIMAAGEDWRGLAGDVARAEAVVAAARGDFDIADRQFEAALAIHQKYHLALEKPVTRAIGDRRSRALAIAQGRRKSSTPRSKTIALGSRPPFYRMRDRRQGAHAGADADPYRLGRR